MKEEMLDDVEVEDDENQKYIDTFLGHLKRRVEEQNKEKKKNPGGKYSYYYPVRNALLDTFGL